MNNKDSQGIVPEKKDSELILEQNVNNKDSQEIVPEKKDSEFRSFWKKHWIWISIYLLVMAFPIPIHAKICEWRRERMQKNCHHAWVEDQEAESRFWRGISISWVSTCQNCGKHLDPPRHYSFRCLNCGLTRAEWGKEHECDQSIGGDYKTDVPAW